MGGTLKVEGGTKALTLCLVPNVFFFQVTHTHTHYQNQSGSCTQTLSCKQTCTSWEVDNISRFNSRGSRTSMVLATSLWHTYRTPVSFCFFSLFLRWSLRVSQSTSQSQNSSGNSPMLSNHNQPLQMSYQILALAIHRLILLSFDKTSTLATNPPYNVWSLEICIMVPFGLIVDRVRMEKVIHKLLTEPTTDR